MLQKILIFNAGSTSLKAKLFSWPSEKLLWEKNLAGVKNPTTAMQKMLTEITAQLSGGQSADSRRRGASERIRGTSATDREEGLAAIGHRVVHGGTEFVAPTKITSAVIKKLARYNILAPLHNPANLAGIKAAQKIWPKVPQVAVFDTAFFAHLPEVARTYALPKKLIQKYGWRRYGFHGLSHQAAAEAAAGALKRPVEDLKIITCHLGGGCSLAAIDRGQAIDTSMGWTTMEGAPMMTRSGDVDAGIVLDLAERVGVARAREILNKESGALGLSGCRDFLDLLKKMSVKDRPSFAIKLARLSALSSPQGYPEPRRQSGHRDAPSNPARLAVDLFVYRIKKYIGAYYAILGGCDALVFTGAIGAGNPETRRAICANMSILGNTRVLSVPANEELQIARGAAKLVL